MWTIKEAEEVGVAYLEKEEGDLEELVKTAADFFTIKI